MAEWIPKTRAGKQVKEGVIKSISSLLERGVGIRETEIVDELIPNLETDLLLIGQSKGKFGGGQRRAFKQTQKKIAEGNKPKFSSMIIVGNRDGYIGLGMSGGRETVPARERSLRTAKKNIIGILRGCGSWECGCGTPHSIPFKVYGRCGSVRIYLMPAPKGVGLAVHAECRKILELAGIKDVWSKTFGDRRSRVNLMKACFAALKKLKIMHVTDEFVKSAGVSANERRIE